MNHLMIDLETLGTKSNSVVMSIAAIPFNLDTGEMSDKPFKVNIDLNSSLAAGLEVSGDTVQWWLTQRQEILGLMFTDAVHLANALIAFNDYIEEHFVAPPIVWGNSARFDLGLLENLYQKMNIMPKWKFRDERCYRTINSLFLSIQTASEDKTDAHNPIVDCRYQIKRLCLIWKHLAAALDADQQNTWNETELQNNYSEAIMLLSTVMESIEAEGLPSAISTNIKTFLDGGQVFQHPTKGRLQYTWIKD